MSYRGRELTAGNYLKLDDLQSQFNSSTTTFNLTSGGTAFYPGSAFSIQVVLGGVIQEPESAYTINQSQITFASAPGSGDDFFCIALGVSLGIGVPGEGTVTGTKLSKPFSYDDGLLVLDSTNNFIGVNSTTPTVALDVIGNVKVVGIITATSFSGSGANLTGVGLGTTGSINTSGIITATSFSGSNTNITGLSTFSGGITVGVTTSITVGSAFIKNNAVGLGVTNDAGRNAGVSTATGTIIFNSTNARLEFYTGNVWVSIKSNEATGGTITFSGGKTIHTFTGSGTFSVNSGVSSVDYLVVAGGGGGNNAGGVGGGGGGAGGFRTGSAFPVTPGPYGITVGGGGTKGEGAPDATTATRGADSIFSTITSTGGGAGGGSSFTPGTSPGGSGGGSGSSGSPAAGTGNTPPVSPPQGNNGDTGGDVWEGGGGGGANANGSGKNGGNGSPSSISGTPTTYAGGGGGGRNTWQGGGSAGTGGTGGGGPGGERTGPGSETPGTAGTTNLGGGGGGGGSSRGMAGGSGIVIITYPS